MVRLNLLIVLLICSSSAHTKINTNHPTPYNQAHMTRVVKCGELIAASGSANYKQFGGSYEEVKKMDISFIEYHAEIVFAYYLDCKGNFLRLEVINYGN